MTKLDPQAAKQETEQDFPREWIEFADPDDEGTLIRADLTWLLSNWTCVFGNGCPGIDPEQPEDGCCLHGAFYTDADDEKRVRKAVKRLKPDTWQHYRSRFADTVAEDTLDDDDGVAQPARKTAVVDGACVFHNRPESGTGHGCALHAQAVRDGVHPMEYKPEVCWQVPIKREFSTINRADGSSADVTWIGEFDRRAWGAGGHEFDWWCASSPLAHVGSRPLYRSYEPELTALLGKAAYVKLAELCAQRLEDGQIAQHPATRKALTLTPVSRRDADAAS